MKFSKYIISILTIILILGGRSLFGKIEKIRRQVVKLKKVFHLLLVKK